jgi:hypothetical protein
LCRTRIYEEHTIVLPKYFQKSAVEQEEILRRGVEKKRFVQARASEELWEWHAFEALEFHFGSPGITSMFSLLGKGLTNTG